MRLKPIRTMTYIEEITNTRLRQPNSMVASISSKVLQIRKENIKESLSDLNTIGHRQDYEPPSTA